MYYCQFENFGLAFFSRWSVWRLSLMSKRVQLDNSKQIEIILHGSVYLKKSIRK